MLLKNLQISPVLESPFNKFEAMRVSSKLVEDDFQIFISSLGQKKKIIPFSGNTGGKKKSSTRLPQIYFSNRFFGDIHFSSLV